MRRTVWMWPWAVVVLGLLSMVLSSGPRAGAQQPGRRYTVRVTIFDNDAKLLPGDAPGTALWGFAPAHFVVTQGERIIFDNPASNNVFHTVTSLAWDGPILDRSLSSGTEFNSTPNDESQLLRPGDTWVLDTSDLRPGHYVFYCQPHPWMVGAFFVQARPAP